MPGGTRIVADKNILPSKTPSASIPSFILGAAQRRNFSPVNSKQYEDSYEKNNSDSTCYFPVVFSFDELDNSMGQPPETSRGSNEKSGEFCYVRRDITK